MEESKESRDPESDASRPTLPRGGFWKGALVALLIVLPAQSALLRLLATDPLALELSAKAMLVTIGIFAGLPALIVFGSIGSRLARSAPQGARANVLRGALLGSAGSLCVVVLAALPTAAFPHGFQSALLTALGSLVIGALAGAGLAGWLGRDSVIS